MLTDRKQKILRMIVEDYISTAEPVGSRTIARKQDVSLSPATVRNEMSDLELMGYLEQPHTSSGRIPSAQAYRFYVDSLLKPGTLTASERAIIDAWYIERVRSIDEIFQSTAKILSRMTRNISMVVANKHFTGKFSYVKFLPLDNNKVILCIVTDFGTLDNCVVDIPMGMNQEELDYLAGRITRKLSGLSLDDINEDVLKDLHINMAGDKLLYTSFFKGLKKLSAGREEEKIFFGGAGQILGQPEFREVERLKSLLGLLEEEKIVRNILNAGKNSGLKVTIGTENELTSLQDCSMVQATYRLNGKVVGTMAVLGPTRMEYQKVISVIDYLHKYLRIMFDNKKDL